MSLKDYIIEKPVLETERLLLRTLRESDAGDLKEWTGDKSIYKYWGKRAGKSDLNPELLFQKKERPHKSFHWGIVHKETGKVIGEMWVYLIENDRMAKTAFRISPAFQGEGFASEAILETVRFCFEKTELKRLWSDVHAENTASYKTLEKAGFKREGLIRDGKMVNVYCDYYIYGITKSDYSALHG